MSLQLTFDYFEFLSLLSALLDLMHLIFTEKNAAVRSLDKYKLFMLIFKKINSSLFFSQAELICISIVHSNN